MRSDGLPDDDVARVGSDEDQPVVTFGGRLVSMEGVDGALRGTASEVPSITARLLAYIFRTTRPSILLSRIRANIVLMFSKGSTA